MSELGACTQNLCIKFLFGAMDCVDFELHGPKFRASNLI